MFRVLAVGNSFSEDATYFLPDILNAAGIENEIINLFIGGCPLERHWYGIENGLSEYQYQRNGRRSPRTCSVKEALAEGSFDAIVTQQASADAGWECTYEPFLGKLCAYFRQRSQAKLYLNETWAYDEGSSHVHFLRYENDQQQMFRRLEQAYRHQAKKNGMALIETGLVMQAVRQLPYFREQGRSITRDSFHLSFLYGRYAAALCWARALTGITVSGNAYLPALDFLPGETADHAVLAELQDLTDRLIVPN